MPETGRARTGSRRRMDGAVPVEEGCYLEVEEAVVVARGKEAGREAARARSTRLCRRRCPIQSKFCLRSPLACRTGILTLAGSTKSQLNNWLRAQRSTGTLQRKGGRLNVVSEVSEEIEG